MAAILDRVSCDIGWGFIKEEITVFFYCFRNLRTEMKLLGQHAFNFMVHMVTVFFHLRISILLE